MHDPEFEKAVQQKMEELSFMPSDAVWTNVEQAIKPFDKRRTVPLFWLLFLPAFLVGGTVLIYMASPVKSGRKEGVIQGSPGNNPGNPVAVSRAGTIERAVPAAPAASAPSQAANLRTVDRRTASLRTANRRTANRRTADRLIKENRWADGHASALPVPANRSGTAIHKAAVGLPDPAEPPAGANKSMAEESVPMEARDGYIVRLPGLALTGRGSPQITAPGLTVKATQPVGVRDQPLQPDRPWEAGFTGGVGISSLSQALPGQQPVQAPGAIFGAVPLNSLPSQAAQSNPNNSTIQPDLSFWAGILAHKSLSKRLAVSIGLDLRYSSSRLHTGDKYNSYAPSVNSLFAPSLTVSPIQTYPYYTTGDDQVFINRYYFLEVPVSAQIQLNHSQVMPIFWEGGFSLSYLVSSNALYYDTHSGLYFKDTRASNKAQFNLATAFMIGLPFGGSRIEMGPQLQYGITSLLNTQVAQGSHLLYGGIKVEVMPGKGKKRK
jgi:Outer membrane protein beta-barrel domain